MLRRGLEACDPWAAEALAEMHASTLLPELTALLDARNVSAGSGSLLWHSTNPQPFQIEVVHAVAVLEPRADHSRHLLPLLAAASEHVRITAAQYAREFPQDSVRQALLGLVRRDPSYFVRYHAAESLLALGDVYPRELADHKGLLADIGPKTLDERQLLFPPPPDATDGARFARAADAIERLIRDRAAAGKCSASIRLAQVRVRVLPVGPHLAALALDDAESSCAKELAFLVFIESPAGFGRWMPAAMTGREPLRTILPLASSQLPIEYRRADGILRIGTVELAAPVANVAFLTAAGSDVTVRYRGHQKLTFDRGAAEARDVLNRSPELRALVAR
jgi:hypothetical protein